MPIVKADEINFEWWKRVTEHYKISNQPKKRAQTNRCLGMKDVFKLGWIQRTYQDIEITTTPGKQTFVARTPFKQELAPSCGNFIGAYVNAHPAVQLHAFKPFPVNMLQTVIKIQSPWFFVIPEGYSLLLMPVPYNDDNRFTAATGVIKTNNFWNVQLYWHAKPGKHIIKAGTPISQIVPIKNEIVDSEIKIVDDTRNFLKTNYPYYNRYYNTNTKDK